MKSTNILRGLSVGVIVLIMVLGWRSGLWPPTLTLAGPFIDPTSPAPEMLEDNASGLLMLVVGFVWQLAAQVLLLGASR